MEKLRTLLMIILASGVVFVLLVWWAVRLAQSVVAELRA